ncbi:MAG: hypothetical protein PWR30_27 [Candidatus Woesearchaeota archaeon]|nr:hypothetical protein [Candidatus Woesearchaeota archaeon]
MMGFKKSLTGIVIAAAVGASVGIGVVKFSQPDSIMLEQKSQIQSVEYTKQEESIPKGVKYLSGTVVGVDEEKFSITGGGSFAKTNGDFYYEIIRVKDENGDIIKILYPYSTPYEKGDYITLYYEEKDSINYNEMVKDYRYNALITMEPLQKGKIDGIDGIVSDEY